MSIREYGILAQAFEKTFHDRTIAREERFQSVVTALFGLQTKYRPIQGYVSPFQNQIRKELDRNAYNQWERFFFFVRIPKNIAKLFTELLWNALAIGCDSLADSLQNSNMAGQGLRYLMKGLGQLFGAIAFIGQSITSPFAAIKDTYQYFDNRFLGTLMATLRGLFSLACYATIAAFVFPYLASALATGSVGAYLLTGLNGMVGWMGSLPGLSALGTAFSSLFSTVGSVLGLSLTATLSTAATVSSAMVGYAAVLAGLKVAARYFAGVMSPDPRAKVIANPNQSNQPYSMSKSTNSIFDAIPQIKPSPNQRVIPAAELTPFTKPSEIAPVMVARVDQQQDIELPRFKI